MSTDTTTTPRCCGECGQRLEAAYGPGETTCGACLDTCGECGVNVHECYCDEPGRYVVSIAVRITLTSTNRGAVQDALAVLSCEPDAPEDHDFAVTDWDIERMGGVPS